MSFSKRGGRRGHGRGRRRMHSKGRGRKHGHKKLSGYGIARGGIRL